MFKLSVRRVPRRADHHHVLPINVVKAHMQLEVCEPYLKFGTVFSKLVAERGLRGMFKDVHLNYTRSFLSGGIINVAYENLIRVLRPVL